MRVHAVQLVCSDVRERRRRVEHRTGDIAGHILPTWDEVVAREYHPWDRDRLVLDTARISPGEAVARVLAEWEGVAGRV